MIEKEFVPYEQTIALKELGINQECYASYGPIGARNYKELTYGHADYSIGNCIGAPTFSQAFRWFREEYKIDVCQLKSKNKYIFIVIYDFTGEERYFEAEKIVENSHEEAELACLKKLIEIVKEQNGKK